jgi:ABC-type uncharacterized transport system ATPase subunit
MRSPFGESVATVEQLCGAVTIIKDGRLVESGPVGQMRYLATSSITAIVTSDRSDEVRAALGRLAVPRSVPKPARWTFASPVPTSTPFLVCS